MTYANKGVLKLGDIGNFREAYLRFQKEYLQLVFTSRKYNSSTKKKTFPPKGTKSHVGSQNVVLNLKPVAEASNKSEHTSKT